MATSSISAAAPRRPTSLPRLRSTADTGNDPWSDLAARLAEYGPAAVHDELARFAAHARRHGVTPLLVAVVADPTQPDVARQRAFGRIAVELAASTSIRRGAAA
jgi:hypothetical protein